MAPNVATATTSNAMASGQIESLWVTITLSTMLRCSSGMTAVNAVASTAPVSARRKLRRYRQQ